MAWLGTNIDQIPVDVSIANVDLKGFKSWLPRLCGDARYKLAAWNWLEPRFPNARSPWELNLTKASCGLSSVSDVKFHEKVRHHCWETYQAHEPLRPWIASRLALLDHTNHLEDSTANDAIRDAAILHRRNLFHISTTTYPFDPDAGADLAGQILRQTLQGVATSVNKSLGLSGCYCTANLMVPVSQATLHVFREIFENVGPAYAVSNFDTANGLWAPIGHDSSRRLIVVGETDDSRHLGFWVPTTKGSRGEDIPGAPKAYYNQVGSAVFKRDLPPMAGFPHLAESWSAYIQDKLTGRLFVSLPFAPPDGHGGRKVVAILNINANPSEDDGWYRAYHVEWLKIAQEKVLHSAEVAFYAASMVIGAHAARLQLRAKLFTGCELWDCLVETQDRKDFLAPPQELRTADE